MKDNFIKNNANTTMNRSPKIQVGYMKLWKSFHIQKNSGQYITLFIQHIAYVQKNETSETSWNIISLDIPT